MATITIPKTEYLKIIKTQEQLRKKVDALQDMFKMEMEEEVRPEYIKKLDRLDAEIDQGKGIRFSNVIEMEKYLHDLK